MGQYWYVVNFDKKEYLHPRKLGDGLKLLEFGCSGEGTMMALAALLAGPENGNGLGDMPSEDTPWVGHWYGDRIGIVGDYGDPIEGDPDNDNWFSKAGKEFTDISLGIRENLDGKDGISFSPRWDTH